MGRSDSVLDEKKRRQVGRGQQARAPAFPTPLLQEGKRTSPVAARRLSPWPSSPSPRRTCTRQAPSGARPPARPAIHPPAQPASQAANGPATDPDPALPPTASPGPAPAGPVALTPSRTWPQPRPCHRPQHLQRLVQLVHGAGGAAQASQHGRVAPQQLQHQAPGGGREARAAARHRRQRGLEHLARRQQLDLRTGATAGGAVKRTLRCIAFYAIMPHKRCPSHASGGDVWAICIDRLAAASPSTAQLERHPRGAPRKEEAEACVRTEPSGTRFASRAALDLCAQSQQPPYHGTTPPASRPNVATGS